MVVSITWALVSNGNSILDCDWGSISSGDVSDCNKGDGLYLRHDGENEINNCGFYIRPVQEGYSGTNSPLDDYQELLNWGSQDQGLLISFDNSVWTPHINGAGSDANLPIEFPLRIIESGHEAHFWLQLDVPISVEVGSATVSVEAGIRQFDHMFRYSYTS